MYTGTLCEDDDDGGGWWYGSEFRIKIFSWNCFTTFSWILYRDVNWNVYRLKKNEMLLSLLLSISYISSHSVTQNIISWVYSSSHVSIYYQLLLLLPQLLFETGSGTLTEGIKWQWDLGEQFYGPSRPWVFNLEVWLRRICCRLYCA